MEDGDYFNATGIGTIKDVVGETGNDRSANIGEDNLVHLGIRCNSIKNTLHASNQVNTHPDSQIFIIVKRIV